ncbi:uncharacterized protein N7459_010072, partial [Penicillium hispanicum]|uniref:uncharacterized protein n=1 Tax=Penicillium hispanicum TaxID=1080232 RepID=UPI0025407210
GSERNNGGHRDPNGRIHPETEERLINWANVVLLISKVAIMALTSSMSMLAGLVDGHGNRLGHYNSFLSDPTLVGLSVPSIGLVTGTVLIRLLCWIWCRLVPSPSVQILAQDAMTDVIFNTFSIISPWEATDHNILLYTTMRFSRVILKIQDLKAYYAGDKLNIEVDLVVDERFGLRDSHDVSESLQYTHQDYDPWNLPSHMNQVDR